MAESLLGAWWDRLRGKLVPRACPYRFAFVLELPGRRLVAAPEKILGAFGIAPGEKVLEIGPGIGFYSVEAARRVGPSGRLLLIDLQLEMLRRTKSRLEAAALAAGFAQASAHALPLESGSIDHVFLIAVLGEIPERAQALAEIKRVLRPGGRLSVSEQVPDPDFITPRALREELTAAGFREEKTKGWLVYTSTWAKLPQI